jgi:hypothetical protein
MSISATRRSSGIIDLGEVLMNITVRDTMVEKVLESV